MNLSVMAQIEPQNTLHQLCEIFPPFADWWAEDETPFEDGLVVGVYYERTHHRVMADFLSYFAMNHTQFTKTQLEQFGCWVNEAVSADGDLENAVSTCFLEHIRQVKINCMLAPYLSEQAKAKSHA
jgi:hypothetical protein